MISCPVNIILMISRSNSHHHIYILNINYNIDKLWYLFSKKHANDQTCSTHDVGIEIRKILIKMDYEENK